MILGLAFLLLGAGAGVVLQRSHFCTMGCISDAVLFGSLRRLRVWALALAIAMLGSQALATLGAVDLAASAYRTEGWWFLGALPGGLLFGFGMVLAGGCVSRNLVRAGSGSMKAGLALLTALLAVVAVTPLLPAGRAAARHDPALLPLLGAAVAAGLLLFSFRQPLSRWARGDLTTGAALGALVVLGWIVTSLVGGRPDSLNYLGPVALALPLAAGTLLGACVSAWRRGELRVERLGGPGELGRHLLGGALMGAGGALASGCTLGQGLTGAATLSPGSLLVLLGLFAGAWRAVRYLETGSLLPPRRAAEPGASGRSSR